MEQEIEKIVFKIIQQLGNDYNIVELENLKTHTPLYGQAGSIDSIQLVNLIANIEISVAEKYGKNIVLADERSMSMKFSPFRSVASLTEYTFKLINEAK